MQINLYLGYSPIVFALYLNLHISSYTQSTYFYIKHLLFTKYLFLTYLLIYCNLIELTFTILYYLFTYRWSKLIYSSFRLYNKTGHIRIYTENTRKKKKLSYFLCTTILYHKYLNVSRQWLKLDWKVETFYLPVV